MRAVVVSAFSDAVAVGSGAGTTLAVIPAKAGIHAAGFVEVGKVVTSIPKAPAEWIPAFAGMTGEGVVVDTASGRLVRRDRPTAPRQSSRAR